FFSSMKMYEQLVDATRVMHCPATKEKSDARAFKHNTLVKLPTYSYDLNPIEMVNGLAKAYAKRNPGLLRTNMPFAIVNAFSQVSPQSVQHFYRKSWQILFDEYEY
ncbi:hypothetical protein QZH41_010507, partial [Actinostola sp. cb2023]